MAPIPKPEDYDISSTNGFLPSTPPLAVLPDPYYEPWEAVVRKLQGLILSGRLREVVAKLPNLSTDRLTSEPEWRRAYSALAFIVHAYIWGSATAKPLDRVPPCLSIPFLAVCKHLQLPPVATYAGVVLWNWRLLFPTEAADQLANLDTLDTFTGALDEKWFYLVSVAIEARSGPIIPLLLDAMAAAEVDDRARVTAALQAFAERLDELRGLLARMYEQCDPRVFYHRIRPFLAGGKNMAEAGLPRGVIFDNGGAVNRQRYVQFSGGSNAQSSVIQFFDIVLGVQHDATTAPGSTAAAAGVSRKPSLAKPNADNFLLEMRKYMPGPHARFLRDVARAANLRPYVAAHAAGDRALALAYDACLAMLRTFRDTHIQMVSRYIILPSREPGARKAAEKPKAVGPLVERRRFIATPDVSAHARPDGADGNVKTSKLSSLLPQQQQEREKKNKKEMYDLKGTGGTALIPFLRQARDETGEPAIDSWTRRLLQQERAVVTSSAAEKSWPKLAAQVGRRNSVQGLACAWDVDDFGSGGLCHI